LHAVAVAQNVLFDGGAVVGFTERFLLAAQAGRRWRSSWTAPGQTAGIEGASWSNFLLLF
jgi:hypothetical protein